MNANEKILRCFVIGPMNNMLRLRTLASQIVLPLVQPYGYSVITPDLGEIGSIMNQVLLNLEQADILIADITGTNANVMYELGIFHSYGKPYITVKDKSVKELFSEKTPFDIAAFRYVEIDTTDVDASKENLKGLLEKTLAMIGQIDWFENPVTVFYNSPVAEIPTAIGLFKNYCRNFLSQILPDIFKKYDSNEDYQLDVFISDPENKLANSDGFVKLTQDERQTMTMEIIMPERMYMVEHEYIKGLKESDNNFPFKNAKIKKRSREFNLHYRKKNDGKIVLADFPSILTTLSESIRVRRKIHELKIEDKEWRILEQQELERFINKCQLFISSLISQSPQMRNKLSIVSNWNPVA